MKIVLATSLKSRLIGLLSSKVCASGEALLLAPCKSIHSIGMRSKIDVAFIDKNAIVLASERDLSANSLRSHPQSVAVLERRSNDSEPWIQPGARLNFNLN